ncbi:MAG: heparinase II/III family protein [Pirellulales bacterium]|nr:heparinase II/III family protein [Pirellulales bacterium]
MKRFYGLLTWGTNSYQLAQGAPKHRMRALRSRIFIMLIMSNLPLSLAASAQDFTYPSTMTLEEVRNWIDRCKVDHPRLLANHDQMTRLKEYSKSNPLGKALAQGIVHQADSMLTQEPIERRLQGRRLLGQSRECLHRVLTLSMAFHLTGNRKYMERAEKEMLVVAAFSDWNPSHFLDVAEMTFAMAIGYDWLFHELGGNSRNVIRTAIIQHGVALPFTSRHKGWVRARNNWGQVCHGGLTAGALAILEDEPDLAAKTVHNALHNVRYSMDAYAPNGSYPEGPGYWGYGTSYNVLLIAVLESALGSDFGLTKAPGFSMTGQYPAMVCGPSGQYFNYADGSAGRSINPTLFWLAKRFNRPDWLFGERERLQKMIEPKNRGNAAGGRFFPLALLWMHWPMEDAPVRMPLHWNSEGEVPITVHRSSWANPGATFVGFKGGSPSANHGHMDIGSFVLDADGVRWAIDLGAEGYYGIESRGMNLWNSRQDSDRWTIFRLSNSGHNTLVIDGQLQHAAGRGSFVKFSEDPAFPHSVLDMSSAYKGQVERVQRGIALLPSGEVLVQDELTGLKPGALVRWGMITPGVHDEAEPGSSTIRLHQGDAKLNLVIMEPATAIWKVVDTSEPRNPWDSPNRGTRMVAFDCEAHDSGELVMAVLATPGSCPRSETDQIKIKKLDTWGG